MKSLSADVTLANTLLAARAATPTPQLLAALFDEEDREHLIDRLRDQNEYEKARSLLAVASARADVSAERAEQIRQQQALCLYKDPDLPARGKLDEAFAALKGEAGLAGSRNPETLGIAGAISRRYWELDGHRSHLERALRYYERGHRLCTSDDAIAKADRGYNGINAAFVNDQLAWLSAQSADGPDENSGVEELQRKRARRFRTDVIELLEQLRAEVRSPAGKKSLAQDWWVSATLMEAYFGLGDFAAATKVFKDSDLAGVAAWKLESTLKQLVVLARLHGQLTPETDMAQSNAALDCLKTILGGRDPKVLLTADQKLGLGLSGGGFRASLYEIGVLAALAEFDLLRHVEVISTVSGGSVLGAHYYLELRNLLQTREDREITRKDYVELVARVATDFFRGVESNIRTRVVLNPIDTFRMFFTRSYSRTMKAGDLYEEHIYRRASGVAPGPIPMKTLFINPKGEATSGPNGVSKRFNPKADNWHRSAKVPILVINATSLNTGHNWQFTASWMGEPLVETDVDANPRMRRMYYDELEGTSGQQYANLSLGHAVAASACVPGLFEPLALGSLYEDTHAPEPGPTTVRLVDGGVHDNQGLGSLLEQDCSVLIIADASGQMPYERAPAVSVLGGVLRTNSAMMARIREAQYRDVKVQREVGRRKGLAFVHMKKDLHSRPVNWLDCKQVKDGTENPLTKSIGEKRTSYGIRKSAQQKLASIRTDLDSFSEIEAYSLMYSGYCATRAAIPKSIVTLPLSTETETTWPFLAVAEALTGEEATTDVAQRFEKHLAVGSKGTFKVWYLDRRLQALSSALLVVGGGAVLWWTRNKEVSLLSLQQVWWLVVGALLTWAVGKWAMRLVKPHQLVTKVATGIGLTLVGWIAAWIHICFFDRWFKRLGRVSPGGSPPVERDRS